jgi:hypothetical protein
MADDLVGAVRESADRLGISPVDLLTTISYETGGRLAPNTWGGKNGQYLGLVQFSPENQKRYGVRPDQTVGEQMGAVENYLRDRGVKPGMGLLDLYSTVNAGRPGLYNRSDAANGGMPGTVADKVATMGPHRLKAAMLLDGKLPASLTAPAAPAAAPQAASPDVGSAAPLGFGGAPANDDMTSNLIAEAQRIAQEAQADRQAAFRPLDLNMMNFAPQNMLRARRLMQSMR